MFLNRHSPVWLFDYLIVKECYDACTALFCTALFVDDGDFISVNPAFRGTLLLSGPDEVAVDCLRENFDGIAVVEAV